MADNVVAFIEGSDPVLKDEVVVVSAHLDHIGMDPMADGDTISNGADDDGSGTVSLLEIAEAFQQAKADGHGPRRSILFLHVSGEEKGLLGSEHYADREPLLPLANTVANLNIDMIGRHDPERTKARPTTSTSSAPSSSRPTSTEINTRRQRGHRAGPGAVRSASTRPTTPTSSSAAPTTGTSASTTSRSSSISPARTRTTTAWATSREKIDYDLMAQRARLVFGDRVAARQPGRAPGRERHRVQLSLKAGTPVRTYARRDLSCARTFVPAYALPSLPVCSTASASSPTTSSPRSSASAARSTAARSWRSRSTRRRPSSPRRCAAWTSSRGPAWRRPASSPTSRAHSRVRCVALRADIDALPIREANHVRLQERDGRRDARLRPRRPHGHAARRGDACSTRMRDDLAGTVRLVFQPSEEKAPRRREGDDRGGRAGRDGRPRRARARSSASTSFPTFRPARSAYGAARSWRAPTRCT